MLRRLQHHFQPFSRRQTRLQQQRVCQDETEVVISEKSFELHLGEM